MPIHFVVQVSVIYHKHSCKHLWMIPCCFFSDLLYQSAWDWGFLFCVFRHNQECLNLPKILGEGLRIPDAFSFPEISPKWNIKAFQTNQNKMKWILKTSFSLILNYTMFLLLFSWLPLSAIWPTHSCCSYFLEIYLTL